MMRAGVRNFGFSGQGFELMRELSPYGSRSEELERYKHFSPSFKQQRVELIAGQLTDELRGTKRGTSTKTQKAAQKSSLKCLRYRQLVAEPTGLEPATSDVTGRRSNQLNYDSAKTSKLKLRRASVLQAACCR